MGKIVGVVVLALLAMAPFIQAQETKGVVRYPYYYPSNQQAFIIWENQTQKMMVLGGFQEYVGSSQKQVWIFPVPATPENIRVDTFKGFPFLNGTELKSKAQENLNGLGAYLGIAAFPPAFVLLSLNQVIYRANIGEPNFAMEQKAVDLGGLTIFEHLDKMGLATEVIKADDPQYFKTYLAARGTNVSPETEEFLKEYMNKDYSFVVTWISNTDNGEAIENPTGSNEIANRCPPGYRCPYPNLNDTTLGLFIEFPSSDIYYPLKPLAYYGNAMQPVTLDIMGFKSPQVYDNIKRESTIQHYHMDFLNRTIQEDKTLAAIFGANVPTSMDFTRIQINAPANFFIQDLHLNPNEDNGAHALLGFNQTWLLWGALLFIGFNLLAAFLANRLFLQGTLDLKSMGIIAIANFLLAFGAALAIGLMDKKKFGVKDDQSGFKRKTLFLIAFEALVLGFAILVFIATAMVFSLR